MPARGPAIAIQRASRAAHIPGDATLRRWARAALPGGAEVTVRYVAETEGRNLNRTYRGKDYATNVLTFTYGTGGALAGDVVICAPVVAREAREQKKRLVAHYAHLTIHGVLHLLGLDHENPREADAMELIERDLLAELGYADPYAER